MANGKHGDHPISDMFMYGGHPFPPDIEERIRRLHQISPLLLDDLEFKPFEWERGLGLDEARVLLDQMLSEHGG